MLKDITDAIAQVAGAIKNIKEIHKAIKDGKSYVTKAHPEIKADVVAMCVELKKTCNAIAVAAGVITNFRFNVSANAIDNEPTRFNDYFIAYKADKDNAMELLRSLKGHCHIIRQHAEKISAGETKTFWRYFGVNSTQREQELGALLQTIYDDEMDFFNIVFQMASGMTTAINDVADALLLNGMMNASKVPEAAVLLNEYSIHFRQLELLAERTRYSLEVTIVTLN